MVNDGRSCGVVYRIISRLFPIVLSWTYHIVVLESRDAPDWTALLAFESGQDTHVERGGGLHVLILLDARRVITILLYSPMLVLEVIRFSSRSFSSQCSPWVLDCSDCIRTCPSFDDAEGDFKCYYQV